MDSNKLQSQINKLNNNATGNNDTARIQLNNVITSLHKENAALASQLLPNGHVPIYVTPQSDQSNLEYMTWNEYNPDGPYGAYDDNYCRVDPRGFSNSNDGGKNDSTGGISKNKGGKAVYPSRNISTGTISLKSCDELLHPEIQNVANLNTDIKHLQLLAKHSLLEQESQSAASMKNTRDQAEAKVREYERATKQYMQLAEMIDNFQYVSKRHKEIINNAHEGSYQKQNKLNIMNDNLGSYLDEQEGIKKTNERILNWLRAPLILFWIIILGLFLLKQV
jgi:hypothetical protein